MGLISKTTTLHMQYTFFVHFFAVKNARLQRKNALFHVLWRIQKSDDDIFLLFMNMNMVYRT